MSDLMDRERSDLRTALRPLFGSQVDPWRMNERVLELFGELLSKSERRSDALDLVPRPYAGFGARAYLRRELRRIARAIDSDKREMYVACLRGAALAMRTEFRMAGMGR